MAAVALVIFDCDGVLIDSERLGVKVEVAVLRELGWPLSESEVVERFMGRSDRENRRAIEAHLGRRLPDDWAQRVEQRYRQAFATELTPVEGVLEALDRITLPSCVASSATHEHLRYTLSLTGLYERFAGRIFSAEDVARGKPAPDLFLHAAARDGRGPGPLRRGRGQPARRRGRARRRHARAGLRRRADSRRGSSTGRPRSCSTTCASCRHSWSSRDERRH